MKTQNTQLIAIEKIKPYAKNAKKHPKSQVDAVARSIKEFGFNQPVVIDNKNVIIVGHGRLEAAKSLGMTEVPVLQVNLTKAQANAYRLADNKLNESDWDMDIVIAELKELAAEDYDISLTGFDGDLILDLKDNDDDIPDVPVKARSVVGDVYEIGKHRVMCGSAILPVDVKKLMGGGMADMVFTDPPYNVNYSGKGKATSNKILNDKMTDDDFLVFLIQAFQQFAENTKRGAGFYIFHSSSTQNEFKKALEASGLEVKNQLIWNKPSAAMGWGDYRWKHEPFYYAGFEKIKAKFYGDRTHHTVVDMPESDEKALAWLRRQKMAEKDGKTTVWTMKRERVNGYVHPTQKPVELIMYALTNSSKEDDLVLDLFGGSGATLIACEKMGRICSMMELDPKYVDIIITRWCEFTGVRSIKKNGKMIKW